MTGYGGAESATGGRRIRIEVRSVNQRFLDLQVRAPRLLLCVEDRIRRHVESVLERGRVTVYIEWHDEAAAGAPSINATVAGELVRELREISKELGLVGDIDIATLARFPQIFDQQEENAEANELWGTVKPVLAEATDQLVSMREAEGETLLRDLSSRVDTIEAIVHQVEAAAPRASEAMKERMMERIRSFMTGGVEVDEGRLAQEVASAAEKADFTEEIVRLLAHVEHARQTFAASGPVGKRLNFLVQEMHREANTIGSKNADVDMASVGLSLKEEIEKLREQVQNVE
jgi:uncharacterized protein (TIGR00255 family)